MSKRCIHADGAPPAMGPYSHAVAAGNFVFCSGQVALRPDGGGMVRGTIEEETHQVFANIRCVLAASNLDFSDVVKTTVFLADMDDFAALNEVYAQYFAESPPARSCFEVARLPGDAKIEIEVIASAREG